ncbi:hypothetical protein GCM10027059_13650 [Myceligenerans halotolerans]
MSVRTTPLRHTFGRAAAVLLLAAAVLPVLALLAGTAPTTAVAAVLAADDDLTWSLAPADNRQGTDRANYAYEVEPGDVIRDAVVVTNRSAVPLELAVYGTDAFTTPDGHLDLLPAGEPAIGLGTWLSFGDSSATLGPGESAEIPFMLRVPGDAGPGDHSGGVVTSLTQAVGDTSLTVDRRLALRVHARVAGELAPGLEVSDVRVSTASSLNPVGMVTSTVTYTLTNTGNARLVPSETVSVTGPAGVFPVTWSGDLDEILPGSSTERTVEVHGVRPAVRAEATVEVNGAVAGIGGGAASAQGAVAGWAVPWALLGLVVVVTGGAVLGPVMVSRRRARSTPGLPSAVAGRGA